MANVHLYPTDEGGKTTPVSTGWGCPCYTKPNKGIMAHDGYLLLGESTMFPGDTRTIGFWFLLGEEAASKFIHEGQFFLWEIGFIGKATVLK